MELEEGSPRWRLLYSGDIGGDRAVVPDGGLPFFAPGAQHSLPFVWATPFGMSAPPSAAASASVPSPGPLSPIISTASSGAAAPLFEVGPQLVAYYEVTIEKLQQEGETRAGRRGRVG